jgi:hypothetical protein
MDIIKRIETLLDLLDVFLELWICRIGLQRNSYEYLSKSRTCRMTDTYRVR